MWNVKNTWINSESEEVSGTIFTLVCMYCVSEDLNLFLYVFAAHTFCVLVCIPPLLGHVHSSVSHSSLLLQLFVRKRNRLREIMLYSSFRKPFFLWNVKYGVARHVPEISPMTSILRLRALITLKRTHPIFKGSRSVLFDMSVWIYSLLRNLKFNIMCLWLCDTDHTFCVNKIFFSWIWPIRTTNF